MTPTSLTFEELVTAVVRQVPQGELDQLAEAVRTADELDTLAGPVSRVEELAAAAMPEPGTEPVRNPGTTRALREVMKLTLDAALDLGHNYVGTEHLLLALANTEGRDDAGGGARILAELGV